METSWGGGVGGRQGETGGGVTWREGGDVTWGRAITQGRWVTPPHPTPHPPTHTAPPPLPLVSLPQALAEILSVKDISGRRLFYVHYIDCECWGGGEGLGAA